MSSAPYEITLDLKRDYHQVLIMKEGDVDSREIIVTITDNGQLFDITGHIAKFKWHKPDHKYVFNDCLIQDKKAYIKCIEQMLVVGGLANVEVILYDLDNQTVLSTMKFDVSIKDSVISNTDIESTDEFGTLNDMILNNKELANSLKELEENISNAEEERTIAENDRVANEEERVNSFNVLMEEANSEVERLKEENDTASASAELAKEYSNISKSYAVGTGNLIRENDVVDNAKYYYEQARSISEGLNGALIPMGTIMFSDLQNQAKEFGYMYNIKDAFITDDTFKEGTGYAYPAGTNVYWTADSYWDCLAGNAVTGVKGNAESEYRAGNVNITPEDIGALPVMYASSLGIANDATLEDFATAVLALEQTTVRVLLWGNQTAYSTIWTEIQEKVGATRSTYGYLICDKTDPRCCYFTFKEYSTSKVWNWTYSTVNGVGMSDEVWGNIPIDAFDNMNDITLAESLGWKRATVGRGIWTDLSSDYVYTAMIPPSDFVSGDTYIVKLNNGSIHKVTGQTYESYIGVNNGTILIGEDVATATASGITTDAVIGKKAWSTSASNGYVLDTGAPLVISTSADVVAWYCNISSSSTVKNGISDSSAITEKGQYALDATEKNASISGTLANQISVLNNNLKNQHLYEHRLFTKSVLVNFTDGKATVDLEITPLNTTQILMMPTTDSTIATRPVVVYAGANTVELTAYTNGGSLVSGTYWISLWGYLVY